MFGGVFGASAGPAAAVGDLTAGVGLPMFPAAANPRNINRASNKANKSSGYPINHPVTMNLVVVESPAKAKTINKYLGRDHEVVASFGHVRDLPAKSGSVDPEHDFRMVWEVDAKAQKRLNDIAEAAKSADKLILATDPD